MKRKILAVALIPILIVACNASTVQAYINLVVGIALQVAQLAGASKATADKVASDMSTVNKLISDYRATDKTAKPGVLNEVYTTLDVAESDLGAILSAAQVKDPKVISAVRASIGIAVTAVESLRTLETGNGPSMAARTARIALPGGVAPKDQRPSPQQLKQAYNLAVSEYPQAQLH